MIYFEEGEKVRARIRKHWFHFLRDIMLFLISVLVPAILLISISILDLPKLISVQGDTTPLWLFALASWSLISWTVLFIAWTDYYLDILIITDRRIFDIEQKGLFSREVSVFRLDRIQDITVNVNGLIPTFFNFGDIHIQTAGEDKEFAASFIPRPYEIKKLISEQQHESLEKPKTVRIETSQNDSAEPSKK